MRLEKKRIRFALYTLLHNSILRGDVFRIDAQRRALVFRIKNEMVRYYRGKEKKKIVLTQWIKIVNLSNFN